MISVSIITALLLASFASAQTPVSVEAIEAHFQQSDIVPDLLPSFNPSALISLSFAGVGDVQPGQLFKKEQVSPTPTVSITPANSSVSLAGTYTLAMVDADIVGSKLAEGQTRHWLVNGVTIDGTTLSNSSAVAITQYAGPWPASGSGPHRYVVLLYSQPSSFKAPTAYSQPNMGVSAFDFNAYVQDSGLGPLVAGTYFTVEEGTATVSVEPTSAVVTSTLPGAASQTSVATSSSSTSAAKPTGTDSASSGATALNNKFVAFTACGFLSGLLLFLN